MPVSEAKRASDLKWHKKMLKQIKFNFHIMKDSDIIARLDSKPNKQGYVKDLIRADIAKGKRFACLASVEADGFPGYYVDVVIDQADGVYDLWLYNEKCPVKSLVISLPAEDQPLADILNIIPKFVLYNVPEYQKKFMET